jgi:hypothetical protein
VRWVATAIAILALTGCSAFPTATTSASAQAARIARADRAREYPTPVSRQRAAAGFSTPVAAIESFALGYTNWTAADIAARMRALAAVSVGQARSAVALVAAQSAQDYELRRGGVTNSGAVEAIAKLPGSAERYVVVTQERTTASNTTAYAGLKPAWHLTLATVAPVQGGGWAVSAWQPQS